MSEISEEEFKLSLKDIPVEQCSQIGVNALIRNLDIERKGTTSIVDVSRKRSAPTTVKNNSDSEKIEDFWTPFHTDMSICIFK